VRRIDIGIIIFQLLTGWFIMPTLVAAQNSLSQINAKAGPVSMHAEGTFDVRTAPLPADDAISGTAIGRYGLDKQFHGDLQAASKGEMLGAGNPATGTAGYVAIEQVTGTLHGRSGSFALQHFGTMVDNKFELIVKVVPGSGTDALSGISGTMTIKIVSAKHSYQFDYELPSAPK
jgi:Protein of unknown function (DUF3224)